MAAGLNFRGLDLTRPLNRIRAGFAALAVNVRGYLRGTVGLRNLLTNALLTYDAAVVSIARLNDTTPAGPMSGYSIVGVDAAGNLFSNSTNVAQGLSGNPVSIIPFRPNASVQPWAYVGDTSQAVTIDTIILETGSPTTFPCTGMVKVRSDGLIYKTGVKEPQVPPIVGTGTSVTTGSISFPATAMPWTNRGGANPNQNFGGTETAQNTNPVVILTPIQGSKITLTVTGTATVNGTGGTGPGASEPTTSGYPGQFLLGGGACAAVLGAFTDSFGNVVGEVSSPTTGYIYSIGTGVVLTVPPGATELHVGIDSHGGNFSANSGAYTYHLGWSLSTSAVSSVLSILGTLTAYYWGDSPFSGPVASYIWKNPNDPGGSGPTRTISTALGSTANDSFIFDATITGGVPALPGIGSGAFQMVWSTLDTTGTIVGSVPVFSQPLPGTANAKNFTYFNFCLVGSIFVPAAGNYTFVLTSHDEIIWGIGGAAKLVSATAIEDGGSVTPTLSEQGQTITVVSGLALLPRAPNTGGIGEDNTYGQTTVVINFPAVGAYSIEIDYDYWYHLGRILLLQGSPTPLAAPVIIPPIEAGVRENVIYWAKYRSSLTGAPSNPSPPSTLQLTPEIANTISAPFSPDPQVDKCDYYRQDSGLPNPTYVGTGPNDGLGGTIGGVVYNTAIVDELSDLGASANPQMDLDDFEPVPSIDLPAAGVVDVSQGVITWISGTLFNVRWLAGTVIEIGAPTQLAYDLYARPTSTTAMYIPSVPDGTNLTYNIAEPILAAQPLPYLFGPTDNINFIFGVGDPLRPGTLYWCKGSNLDSWPDTNQQDVTDPSEALVNGDMSGGLGVLFSIKRAWIIVPNFFNDVATVTGTAGSTWTLQATAISRGLYIPRCVKVQGGGNIFFRVSDGIHISPHGMASKSITDDELYPLFAHESPGSGTSVPAAITRNGVTISPPNDTLPEQQQFSIADQFLYWDYTGLDGNRHTLVFDTEIMAWVWDTSSAPAVTRATNRGESVQGVLVGCSDFTVRELVSAGATESATATIVTPAIGAQGFCHIGQITVEYSANAAITLTPIVVDEGNGSFYSGASIPLPSTGGVITKYEVLPAANKFKLMQFKFTFTDPSAQIYLEGFSVMLKAWGSSGAYTPVNPFAGHGGAGGHT